MTHPKTKKHHEIEITEKIFESIILNGENRITLPTSATLDVKNGDVIRLIETIKNRIFKHVRVGSSCAVKVNDVQAGFTGKTTVLLISLLHVKF